LSLYSTNDVPFIHLYDYRYIKETRRLRNLTLNEFSIYMKTDVGTLSKLENNQLQFTIHYESKFKDAIQELKLSNLELLSIKRIIEMKAQRGIN
jgi:transcriptional regulator with XRE-family HTH domain